MVDAVVQAFVDAKLEHRDASVALYAVASESGGEAVVAKLTKKARIAMSSMLKTAPGIRILRNRFHGLYVLRRYGRRDARGPGSWILAENGGEPPHTSGSSGRVVLEQRSEVERSCSLKQLRPNQFVYSDCSGMCLSRVTGYAEVIRRRTLDRSVVFGQRDVKLSRSPLRGDRH
jgi:hypothetical protein